MPLNQPAIDIIILLSFFALGLLVVLVIGKEPVSIQLHDTYFVIEGLTVAIFLTGPLFFVTFLVKALRQKFRPVTTNVGLVVGVVLMAIICYYIIRFNTYIH